MKYALLKQTYDDVNIRRRKGGKRTRLVSLLHAVPAQHQVIISLDLFQVTSLLLTDIRQP